MDIGIGVCNLSVIGLSEATSIKVGEYLFAGLAAILGYKDSRLNAGPPFILEVDLNHDTCLQKKINEFIQRVKNNPLLRAEAHEFAKDNLLVNRYIDRILVTAPERVNS